ncbi:MAG TPA: GntR family transcriptional regulator [Lacunisphaera sp.]|jgi:GntR family transcriptional regulator|nr:GntR family transcriptional regulator [Lacunisphaera sp.]
MLPFTVELKAGLPIAEQVIFAVKKAVVAGQLKPGQPFPSVRIVSQELKINPNTAHKIVAALVAQGVLITTPAVGSVVAEQAPGDRAERAELLGTELERLVVEARNLGLTLDEVTAGLAAQWKKLGRK